MREMSGRIRAIALTDVKFRFRRTAGLILMLGIAAGVYLVVPDIRTGVTLMQIDNHRVVYNSAAIALGTSMFCSVILVLTGYYLVSNSFRRDILTRTGFIIASTPVTNGDYIVGKFLGSALYLSAAMMACMLSSIVMFLIRGEGPLEPFTFLSIYLWMVLPGVLFCSAMGLFFESVPFLSGRFGDVLYFFVATALMGVPAALMDGTTIPEWIRLIDLVGLGSIVEQLAGKYQTTKVSIGQSSFDPAINPILYTGFTWGWRIVLERVASVGLPAVLLIAARFSFHRFNPTRLKASGKKSHGNPVTWLNAKLKKMTIVLRPLNAGRSGRASWASSLRADILMTLLLSPLTLLAIAGFAIASLAADNKALREGVLPAMIGFCVVAVADVVTRDGASGLTGLLFTTPGIKSTYVAWKFMSALVVIAAFTLLPIIRLTNGSPSSAVSLAIGSCLIASTTVGFSVMTRSRKAFMATFLMLLYIALNARDEALFDFAGFNGCATPVMQTSYVALTAAVLFLSHLIYKKRLAER